MLCGHARALEAPPHWETISSVVDVEPPSLPTTSVEDLELPTTSVEDLELPITTQSLVKEPHTRFKLGVGTSWLILPTLSVGFFSPADASNSILVEGSLDVTIAIAATIGVLFPAGPRLNIGPYIGIGLIPLCPIAPAVGVRGVLWLGENGRSLGGPYFGIRLGFPLSQLELGYAF